MTNLTAEQQAGIERIRAWHQEAQDDMLGMGAPVFRLFGPAGTGKTTLAKQIPAALGLDRVRYGTFTGKAAHVLRGKGADPVSTIHSGIYYPTSSAETRAKLEAARLELADTEKSLRDMPGEAETISARIVALEAEIKVLEQECRRVSWEWNPESEWASADLIILDEVSMVGAKLAADIEAYGVPVLVLGDPAQLPPVEGGGYYTDSNPDFLLTEIHRQALESPVLELATRVRTSRDIRLGLTPADMVPASMAAAMEADQILTWSNKRRWAVIETVRRKLGRPAGVVVAGDRIMCLTNSKDLAVFNGQQFDVLDVAPATLGPTLTVRTEAGQERSIPVFDDGFQGREMQEQAKNSGSGMRGRMLATFANAITVHKAQGSEWGSVYVVNETPSMLAMDTRRQGQSVAVEQARRWLYTGITRASDTVTVTRPAR